MKCVDVAATLGVVSSVAFFAVSYEIGRVIDGEPIGGLVSSSIVFVASLIGSILLFIAHFKLLRADEEQQNVPVSDEISCPVKPQLPYKVRRKSDGYIGVVTKEEILLSSRKTTRYAYTTILRNNYGKPITPTYTDWYELEDLELYDPNQIPEHPSTLTAQQVDEALLQANKDNE